MKLLDGSLSGKGSTTSYGPSYGVIDTTAASLTALKGGNMTITSSIAGAKITFAKADDAGATGEGGESAVWNAEDKEMTVYLANGKTYSDAQINELMSKARNTIKAEGEEVPEITFKSQYGTIAAPTAKISTTVTVAGKRTTGTVDLVKLVGQKDADAISKYADKMEITFNTYGSYKNNTAEFQKITVSAVAGVKPGQESVSIDTGKDATATAGAEVTLKLASGVDYSEKDIENILAKGGYDVTVKFDDAVDPDGTTKYLRINKIGASDQATLGTEGAGVGKDANLAIGEGLTFQIGANGVEDQRVTLTVNDMSSTAIGVANMDVSTRDAANKGIEMVDKAVKTVSMQRAGLGALQNRLEYTVNNLTTTNENLTNAESQIRDTDMATEMINYTKFNILQQASQAMLAQANQQPQAVLQLLG